MSNFPYNRIVVIGTTSSGKSTLAEQLAKRFDLNFIELDALHWESNWQEAPLKVFRARVEKATQAERWVVAGNYHIVRDLIWPKAEAVIWLDYSLPLIFGRLWNRTWGRWWLQEELWNGNRERLWWHFKIWSQESLFHWLFKTYWIRKHEYPALLALPEHKHLKLIRLNHPGETDEWLKGLDDLLGAGEKMEVQFKKLTEPTAEIAASLSKWENDPDLIPLIRPNPNKEALLNRESVTAANLVQRLEHSHIYLIYLQGQLVGEMDYQIDPKHLYKKESGTAWIGIILGEEIARGKGIGYRAIQYLEEQIKLQGLKRIELGVFEFNTNAVKLYQKLGYKEIVRINDFTYWQDKMWQDIRMEKYL